jgi:hypothetical protein
MLVEGASGNQVRAGMPRLFYRMAEALDLGTFAKTKECGRLRRDPDDRGIKDGKTGDEAFEQMVQHARSLFWCMRVNGTARRGGGNGVRMRCSVIAHFTAWKDDAPGSACSQSPGGQRALEPPSTWTITPEKPVTAQPPTTDVD